MRIITHINNVKCLEWGLTANQGALFDLINQLQSWAETVLIGNEVYYWASKNMICKEIPLFFAKPDAVYRNLKILQEKGLIDYIKLDVKDCIRLTQKGKEWNSGLNPSDVSKPEEPRFQTRGASVSNPTYNITSYNITNDNITSDKPKPEKFNPINFKPKNVSDEIWNDFIKHRIEIKSKLTETSCKALKTKIEGMGEPERAIELSIENGWKGVFDKPANANHGNIYAKQDIRIIPTTYKENDGTLMKNAKDEPINDDPNLPF